jgi:L-aminopeptidase/D-esterase-like protein
MPSQNLLTKIRPVISYAPEIFTAIGAGIGAVVGAFGGGVGAAPGAVTGSKVGSFVGAGILTAYNIYTRVEGEPDIWPGKKW